LPGDEKFPHKSKNLYLTEVTPAHKLFIIFLFSILISALMNIACQYKRERLPTCSSANFLYLPFNNVAHQIE
jgi:putative component of membrane protein insertase Oxa1/YidC/SpoIIIJ protein YidD